MRISLLQCFSRSIRRGTENRNGGGSDLADRKYLSFPRTHPFSVKITFPFSQAVHVTHWGKQPTPLPQCAPFPFLAFIIPGTCAQALPGVPTCLLWRIQSQWRRGWRFRYEFPAFRYAAVADIEYTQFEKRGISAAKFSTSCASLIFHTSPRRDINESYGSISHSYRYEGSTIDPPDQPFRLPPSSS